MIKMNCLLDECQIQGNRREIEEFRILFSTAIPQPSNIPLKISHLSTKSSSISYYYLMILLIVMEYSINDSKLILSIVSRLFVRLSGRGREKRMRDTATRRIGILCKSHFNNMMRSLISGSIRS